MVTAFMVAAMRQSTLLVLAAQLFVGASASAHYRYGAMEVPEGFSPRYYLGASPDQALARRATGDCGINEHSCLDVGGSVCCTNSQYCIVGSNFVASCCAIGSNCGNPCDSAHYQCPLTTSVSGTATVLATCCSRSCPSTSAFKCASAYGGNCCSFGSTCASGGSCISTAQTTSTKPVVVSEIPSGCTTSQISCASSLGGGCCDNGLSCTVLSNVNYCASNTMMATRTGTDGVTATAGAGGGGGGGLSSGAKAGIGAGVAGGAFVILGGLLWFCMAKRRTAARLAQGGGAEEASQQQRNSMPAMSQASNSVMGGGKKRHLSTSDYFGPTAGVGPFTESAEGEYVISPIAGPGNDGAVPAKPHGPGDIAVPVEIDSGVASTVPTPGNFSPGGYREGETERDKKGTEGNSPVELP